MFRTAFVVAALLGSMATAKATASPFAPFRDPNRKILPGHHHPIYRRYGHHGIFHNGFLGLHNRRQTGISGSSVGKGGHKRRGTL